MSTQSAVPQLVGAKLVMVIDGDTIQVRLASELMMVRLIGVDTPETKDPDRPVMCFGAEATAYTKEFIERASRRVLLEKDVSETDRHGRLLRYVWVDHPDGRRMLNQELVQDGYAQAASFPPDVRYQEIFVEAQRNARESGRGLWGSCGEFGVPAATPTATPAPAPTVPPTATPSPTTPPPPPPTPTPEPAVTGECDPSYPTVCIAPYWLVGDLDCGDIPHLARFLVLPPDPHYFDADYDGIGCEWN